VTLVGERTEVEWEPAPTPTPGTDDKPRVIRRFGRRDFLELGGAAIAGLCLALLLVGRFGPFQGLFGLLLIWYLSFVVIHLAIVREGHGSLAMRDRAATVLVTTAGVLTVLPLAFVLTYVVIRGLDAALHSNFFTEDMSTTGAANPLSQGGILHALIGTLEQVAIALVICVPLALATAVYLNEVRGRFANVVRFFVNSLSGTPSIVAGLFVFSIFVIGRGFSGFAAALALSILMLPTVTRTAEEVLRLVPGGLREAALALGAPEWRVTMRVVMPTARSGIITAVILGVARVAGEAAPVLMTAFGGTNTNTNPFVGNQESLPLTVYSFVRQPSDNQQARAWGAGLVLMALILLLFSMARIIGARGPGRERRLFRRRKKAPTPGDPA
jgi:phosphate transport system permease protein